METNFNGVVKLMLHKMGNPEIAEVNGRRCVCLPVDENEIFINDKGGMYMSFDFTFSPGQWGNTHILKVSKRGIPKEDRIKRPIVGSLTPWEYLLRNKVGQQQQTQYQAPQQPQYRQPAYQQAQVQQRPQTQVVYPNDTRAGNADPVNPTGGYSAPVPNKKSDDLSGLPF